ncbi:MAG: hypothetical protein WDA75_22475 [Candidatus Latescibacterota bacterium]
MLVQGEPGESWTQEEPYHGQSLRNSVLRVPLYFHLPGTGNLEPTRPILSTIDLFPTTARLLNLEIEYRSFGLDLWHPGPTGPWLAEIEPLDPHDDRPAAAPTPAGSSLWSVFDAEHKLTIHEVTDRVRLERTFTEERIEDPAAVSGCCGSRRYRGRHSLSPRRKKQRCSISGCGSWGIWIERPAATGPIAVQKP